MSINIIYIGLDVDDTNYHGSAFDPTTGELFNFKSRPTLKCLIKELKRVELRFGTYDLSI